MPCGDSSGSLRAQSRNEIRSGVVGMLLEGAESGLSPDSVPFIKQPYFCATVRQTETSELNTLANLLVAKHGCRNQGSDSGNQSKRATDKSEAVAGLGQVALCRLLTLVVGGVGVRVRIGRGVSAVAPFSPAPGWASAFQPAYRVNSGSAPSTAASKS